MADDQVDVVAQFVETRWGKDSRGGAAAVRRAAVPIAYALPDLCPPVLHSVLHREEEGFAPQISLKHVAPTFPIVRLRLEEGGDALRVLLGTDWYWAVRSRPPALRLRRGEWVRWRAFHRWQPSLHSRRQWIYSTETLNLAFGSVTDPELFLGEPTRFVDERKNLTIYRWGSGE
ncbi:hypothetical protein ACOBQX_09570 [Actinokineospora sp. G85]|uniref:hypothetical protein n=1 Tax=Actinokineospora sp. G85 TaxID=3406626 RepID=UPI003C77B332